MYCDSLGCRDPVCVNKILDWTEVNWNVWRCLCGTCTLTWNAKLVFNMRKCCDVTPARFIGFCQSDLLHKSHFSQCTISLQKCAHCALWDIYVVHCGICEMGIYRNDMDVFKEIHGKTPELHATNDHPIRYAMCFDSSQIQPRYFRQLWICNVLASGIARLTKGKLVVLWMWSFQVNMGTNLSRKFVNEHMLVIEISIPIVKCPRMLLVQSLAQNKPCKSKPETKNIWEDLTGYKIKTDQFCNNFHVNAAKFKPSKKTIQRTSKSGKWFMKWFCFYGTLQVAHDMIPLP